MKQFVKQLKASYSALGIKEPLVWQLSNVMITPESITMTNLQTWVAIRNPLSVKDSFMIDASELIAALSFMDREPEIHLKENKLHLTSGEDRFSFQVSPIDDFPKTPEEKQEKIGVIGELSKLKTAAVFASKDELRIALNYVCLRGDRIYSTDAHRLFYGNLSKVEGEVLITTQAIKIMGLFDMPFELYRSEKYLTFSGDGITVMQRIVDERYPDAETVIPSGSTTEIKANKSDLIAAAERALKIGNKITKAVIFDLNGSLNVYSEDPDFNSEFSTVIECEKQGDDIKMGFNSAFLLSILDNIEGDTVAIGMTTPNRAAVINDSFVLMPIMVNG